MISFSSIGQVLYDITMLFRQCLHVFHIFMSRFLASLLNWAEGLCSLRGVQGCGSCSSLKIGTRGNGFLDQSAYMAYGIFTSINSGKIYLEIYDLTVDIPLVITQNAKQNQGLKILVFSSCQVCPVVGMPRCRWALPSEWRTKWADHSSFVTSPTSSYRLAQFSAFQSKFYRHQFFC